MKGKMVNKYKALSIFTTSPHLFSLLSLHDDEVAVV